MRLTYTSLGFLRGRITITPHRAVEAQLKAAWEDVGLLERLLETEVDRFRAAAERRDEDGQRLYLLLGRWDTRDGSPEAALVQAAREGWERSHPDMAEDTAWREFDDRWASDIARRRAAASTARGGDDA